ncbi:hypothetical protein BC831DRAFT_501250 [Entophlyctis helioformis]|nr:hypothetical protein BC831DRAFT_501250 [Entophlyctis helioformis]
MDAHTQIDMAVCCPGGCFLGKTRSGACDCGHGRHKLKKNEDGQRDATWMELERHKLQAYEYLCHVGEAKEWIEACIEDELPPIDQLEEQMRNGIVLARLAKFFAPEVVKRIFEDTSKLQFRHSDNINYLFTAMHKAGLPDVFFFELTDLYDKKNIPKVIYCIHALSHLLAKKGITPKIKNLVGKLEFTDEQLDATVQGLEDAAVPMPAFGNIQNALAAELNEEPEETPEEKRKRFLAENEKAIVKSQAVARGHLVRKRHQQRKAELAAHEKDIVKIQALWRGRGVRKEYQSTLTRFKSNETLFTKMQARYKAKKQRQDYLKRLKYLNANESAAVKLQAWWKGNQAMKQYKALLNSKDSADVKTVQSYIHLLDDGVNDFDEELDVQKLRRLVIKGIRENLTDEQELNELDMKIALLVKNTISLDEVIHFTSKKMRAQLAESAAALEKEGTHWTLKGSDKETKERRRRYEELFYLLQTQPIYLARLMFTMNKKFGAGETRFLEQVVLTLYGYAQNTREEYLFLSLIESAVHLELSDINKLEEFWRDNPFFIKLVLQYTRGAKERQFLRDLLQPVLKIVIEDSSLELESDAMAIYKNIIREDELRTGEKSTRSYDATPQQAAQDPEVQEHQVKTFLRLKEITDKFLTAITGSLSKMPYGIRYIALKMKENMKKKFPGATSDEEINKIVGNLIYYRYMNPAIIAPEAFDVIDTAISPVQRKNLAEVAKMLHNISLNRDLGTSDNAFTTRANEYIKTAGKRFAHFLKEATNVETAQEHFNMDEYVEFGRNEKPIIYISPEEVVQVHRNLAENIDTLAVSKDDQLRIILNDLGTPPAAADGVTPKGPGGEVALTLTNRFAKTEDESETRLRLLVNETKRLLLTIIRFTTGKSLLDILEAPSNEAQEKLFGEYLDQETKLASEKKERTPSDNKTMSGSLGSTMQLSGSPTGSPEAASPASPSSAANYTSVVTLLKNADGSFMTFLQLKVKALENMAQIEAAGQATKADGYQSMLNVLVEDLLNKQRRRAQRRREFQSLQTTLVNLEEKAKFMEEQKKSYHDYIDACMAQLTNKKGKPKKAPLFSRQYYHMRDLQKSGKVPQFGSYKYSAADLHKKGVLISIDDYSPKQYGQITLTISSDEAGVFNIEASFLGVKLSEKMELRLEDLLQSQYSKVDVVTLFDMAKVNLNLLIFLINKKFYV